MQLWLYSGLKVETDGTVSNKHITYDSLDQPSFNLKVNGFRVYQEDVDTSIRQWREVKRVFGENVNHSTFYHDGDEYKGDKFVLVSKLNALQGDFISGAATNQHVSSLQLELKAGAPLSQTLRMDIFLLYDRLLKISDSQLQVIQ